jgi:hypothetical protein
MRTAVAIFLLALLASVQTPVGQLFKLPLLVEHFIKHKKQEGVSMLAFLQDHYSSSHDDADRPEDETLPFKNILLYSIGVALVPAAVSTQLHVALFSQQPIIFPLAYTPQQHLASIFHPPRM